ncbi:DUF4097 family beta strand repeat-containing protein [Streptomyces abikoensis]|uniref:DUF4097 domain-containing protein n=1 Tax=Streptomyces luteoverticillatus TaxID=66425 RepID=A0A3S9PJZ8_STRLT|nr:DUF4097 family beta strand repeat-containing protein [Streptomyces luteoverticillatus]AZQ72637.1 hypothetical protein EKH77_16690 [Streptomyces luteoverticillatus]
MNTSRTAAMGSALAAIAGLLLCGCSLDSGVSRTVSDTAEVNGDVSAINLKDSGGVITVRPGRDKGVKIERTVHYSGDRPHPDQSVDGGVLSFDQGCSDCFVDYTLTVPAATNVKIDTSGGTVKVQGVAKVDVQASAASVSVADVPGPVKVRGASGSVRLDALRGSVDVKTASGSINGTALRSADVVSRSTSGETRLVFATAPTSVKARTTGADLTLELPDGPYRVRSGGSVPSSARITVPQSGTADRTIEAEAVSGQLQVIPPR